MKNLIEGTLVRRYKRFLADIELPSGELITAHCPNTGSMKNCTESGARVWLSTSDNPKRKYRHTWEYLMTARGDVIGINTGRANTLVEEALRSGVIEELRAFDHLRREVKYGSENSRIDFLLDDSTAPEGAVSQAYVEVKSVTLLENPPSSGIGYFPDAVSDRGAKHLRELMAIATTGEAKAVLLFCVQHTGIQEVRPAEHLDPVYAELLRQSFDRGVQLLAYKVRKNTGGFRLWRRVPVVL